VVGRAMKTVATKTYRMQAGAVLFGVLFLFNVANAQSMLSFAGGFAVSQGTGRGGQYDHRTVTIAQPSLEVRLARFASIAPFVALGVDVPIESGENATCRVAPQGGCVPNYPQFVGAAVNVGLALLPTKRIEARMGAGGGVYEHGQSRLGGVTGQADVAFFVTKHAGLALGARFLVMPHYRGDRLVTYQRAVSLRFR
ncbi:MAG: hypothetical protein ABJC26_07775, partial [Gemmatimonadaceae bacterium]